MRRIPFLLAALCAAFAQEAPEPGRPTVRERIRGLERRAEKLLDEGRRAEALALLAEAADLRAGVGRALSAKPPEPRQEPAPVRAAVHAALAEMDRAVAAGDLGAARRAAATARELLGAWERDLEARERRLLDARAALPVERRLDELERQVRELREMLGRR